MYNKNSNDSIKSQFIHQVPPTQNTNNINLNNAQEPKSQSQVRQDVPTTNVNLNKEDLVKLFNVFMRAATDRGVININGGIHVHIDKIVNVNKVNK